MITEILIYITASLAIGLLTLMAYEVLPRTPRNHSKGIKAMVSPITLVIYLLVIGTAFTKFLDL